MISAGKRFKLWENAIKKGEEKKTDLMWPSETLVRLMRGNYIPGAEKDYEGKKVIDVGFGNGNNMIFLATLGLKLYGTEVTEKICGIIKKKMASLGVNAGLKVGTNGKLPFEDEEMDYLVSWNVIHYANTERKMRKAIKEYARVLKPGGRFFISTTGPGHLILKNATPLGNHIYRIGRTDDFRKGQTFFYFDSPKYIRKYFSEHFKHIMIGKVNDMLMTEMQDYFIITGVK